MLMELIKPKKYVTIGLSDATLSVIDSKRGDVPRSAFCRRVIVEALNLNPEEALIRV